MRRTNVTVGASALSLPPDHSPTAHAGPQSSGHAADKRHHRRFRLAAPAPSLLHPTKDHLTKDHPTKDYPTKDHPTKDYPTKDHPTKDHPTNSSFGRCLRQTPLSLLS
jgi:hypothetical protein